VQGLHSNISGRILLAEHIKPLLEMGEILIRAASIANRINMVRISRDDGIIDNTPAGVGEEGKGGLGGLEGGQIANQEALQELYAVLPVELELQHVGDVEEGGRVAGLVMLLDHPWFP